MAYFNSDKVTVYPTAYRQYTSSGTTTVKNPEARLGTEYNTTNLVNGMLDKNINSGAFVTEYDSTTHVIKFCIKGYYFIVDLTNYGSNIYVKANIYHTLSTDANYKNMWELAPISYPSQSSRNLDNSSGNFLGLDYVTTRTTGYFPLLVNGEVPEKSWLKFSLKDIGYLDGSTWVSIATKFKTGDLVVENNATVDTLNGMTIANYPDRFLISGGVALSLSANMTNTNTFSNSSEFTNSGGINNTASFTNSGAFTNSGTITNKATTTINKNLTVGSTSTYTGEILIKSKKNLNIIGDNSANSTLTFKGTSTFQSGDYESDTVSGSESIKVGGNSFNIVTRDTDQTITGIKEFNGSVTILDTTQPTSANDGALKVKGGINTCYANNYYRLSLGNYGTDRYGLNYYTGNDELNIGIDSNTKEIILRSNLAAVKLRSTKADATNVNTGTLWVDGSITTNYRNYFLGLTLADNYLTLGDNKKLTMDNELEVTHWNGAYTGGKVILSTKSGENLKISGDSDVRFWGKGIYSFEVGNYSSGNSADAEYITLANKTFNVATRDTQQTISGKKIFTNDIQLGTSSLFKVTSNGFGSFQDLVVRNANGVTNFNANSSGYVYANFFVGNYYSSSDKRLKENIKPFINTKSILDLPIYTFDYIDGKKNNIGCMAQDLQELYPELVNKDDKGYLNIMENKLVYLLLDEVKKLKEEIQQLKK